MAMNQTKICPFYPDHAEVDAWIASIFDLADHGDFHLTLLDEVEAYDSVRGNRNFSAVKMLRGSTNYSSDFYGYWQPCYSGPAPLVVHVPGYGAEMSFHPAVSAEGYNVLHISPLGYMTPGGPDLNKQNEDGVWPVLDETARSGGTEGYRHWLANCVNAISWAMEQSCVIPNRVSFMGTSQGGGGSLLLGSLFRDRGTRCVCADVPFLTNFPLGIKLQGEAYQVAEAAIQKCRDQDAAWHAFGLVDTLSHTYRMTFPVLLTTGTKDVVCPRATVESLFDRLDGMTKSLTVLQDQIHDYTSSFMPLCNAWLRLFA